jgi:hypothetical protein
MKFFEEDDFKCKCGCGFDVSDEFKTFKEYTDENDPILIRENHVGYPWYTSYNKCPLEIAAPLKDFDMKNMEVKNYKVSEIEIPDPVVLKPVLFNKQKFYLIVTAWGEEASDELVVNHKFN